MRNRISYGRWLIVLFLAVACLSPTAALASNKGIEVPCRVEPNTVSLSITDGDVAYGVVELGTTEDTVTLGDTQIVQNTSTEGETVNFNIMSSDATDGVTWTLAGAPGADVFTHEFSINDGTDWTAMTTGYGVLDTDVAAGGQVAVDLKIGMPTSISDYGVQHTITVTIQAVTGG